MGLRSPDRRPAAPGPDALFHGYLFAAIVMLQAGVVEALIGVKAERTSLEDIAQPLYAVRRFAEKVEAVT